MTGTKASYENTRVNTLGQSEADTRSVNMGYNAWVKVVYYKGNVFVKKDRLSCYKFGSNEAMFEIPPGVDRVIVKFRHEACYDDCSDNTSMDEDLSSEDEEEEEEEEGVTDEGSDEVGCGCLTTGHTD